MKDEIKELNMDIPNPIQDFDGNNIDLSQDPEIYQRFLELIEIVEHPETGQLAEESLIEMQKNPLYEELEDSEKKILVDSSIHEYEMAAKEILLEEFPVLDQLILEDKLKQEGEL